MLKIILSHFFECVENATQANENHGDCTRSVPENRAGVKGLPFVVRFVK